MPRKSTEAARASRRRWYQRNREREIEKQIARNVELRREMHLWLRTLKDVPCPDCGQRYPHPAMTFDHLPGFVKCGPVNLVARNGSWAALRAEVAKCEVVCANCHNVREWNKGHPGEII